MHNDGLLRVGGRLGKFGLSHSEAHPVVLPKQGNISGKIIQWYHDSVAHCGIGMTLNNLRQIGF